MRRCKIGVDVVNCNGYFACYEAAGIEATTSVNCGCYDSCKDTTIDSDGDVDCDAEASCKDTIINAGNTPFIQKQFNNNVPTRLYTHI